MSTALPKTPEVNLSAKRRWASLAVLTASLLVIVMDMTILNVALPQLSANLQPTAEQQLWIVDAYSLALAGLLVTMSGLADRFGRRLILVLGYLLFGVASVLVFFANTPEFVIVLRILLGIGGAMIMPATLSLLRSVFPNPKERATALAVWAGVSAVGGAIGPIVGGFLLEHFSWHAAFLVNVPLMAAALVAALLILPEVRLSNPGRWDFVGTLLSIGGLALLPWSIKRFAQEQTLAEPGALIGLAVSIILIALFVRRCLNRPDPLLDVRLFKRRPFAGSIIAAIGSMFALSATMFLLAQWMQLVLGYTPLQAGLCMLPLAITGLLSALIAPSIARKLGGRATVAVGIGLAGLGSLIIWLFGNDLTLAPVIVAMVCIGMGEGSLTIASAVIMSGTPPEKAGSAAALEETSYDLGNVLGVAIVGSIAALLYRSGLDASSFAGANLDPALVAAAQESLGAAIDVAHQANLPELALQAQNAFTIALADASLVGGILLAAAALAAFFIIPKGTDIDTQAH